MYHEVLNKKINILVSILVRHIHHCCIVDVDECSLALHDCSQACLNTEGSYMCACRQGYQIGTDAKSCYRKQAFRCLTCT